jgi:serine phosphatase RsbU (regulator of sigma subunit)
MPETDYHVAKVPLLSEEKCGDTSVIKEFNRKMFFAVVDVLGHGSEARALAIIIETFLAENCREDLIEIIVGLHEHIKGSRGAAAALCLLDRDSGELKYTGIGNITVRTIGRVTRRLLSRDGVIGYMIRSPIEKSIKMADNDILLAYSDGIKENFEFEDNPGIVKLTAKRIATLVMTQFNKKIDDAICLALRYRK